MKVYFLEAAKGALQRVSVYSLIKEVFLEAEQGTL